MAAGTATPGDENGLVRESPESDFRPILRPRVFNELWLFSEELPRWIPFSAATFSDASILKGTERSATFAIFAVWQGR